MLAKALAYFDSNTAVHEYIYICIYIHIHTYKKEKSWVSLTERIKIRFRFSFSHRGNDFSSRTHRYIILPIKFIYMIMKNLLVGFAVYQEIHYMIRISKFKSASDGLVESLCPRRCLAHVIQNSAQLSLTFAKKRKDLHICFALG